MTQQTSSLRQEVDRLIAASKPTEAYQTLQALWRAEPTIPTAVFVQIRYQQLLPALYLAIHPPKAMRLTILRSFTVEPIVPLVRAAAAMAGIDLHVTLGGFNTYAQEMLNPTSVAYTSNPDVVILAVQTRDIAPKLWDGFAELTINDTHDTTDTVTITMHNLMVVFRGHTNAALVIHTLELPVTPPVGILDGWACPNQSDSLRAINSALRDSADQHHGVYLLDYDALVARHGRLRWHDEAMYHATRQPIAADYLVHLANEWLRYLVPLSGHVAKCLVLDLDNTLWRGVVGEDGYDGIRVSYEYRAAQRAALDLYQRGIILAVCSKNNPDDAMRVLRGHPDMLLRPDHLAAARINWRDKATNLREIAADLNIGTDALAFLDDSPAERALVRAQLPEVLVLEPPDDPAGYAATIRDCPAFERLTLTQEDKERGRYYAAERQRVELQQSTASLEDYLRSLQMVVEIGLVTPETDAQTVARVAQLTQKTNQFNTTGARYTEQEIRELATRDYARVYWCRLRDWFGDQGIIGVAIVYANAALSINPFLLSCRAIGRGVETALLATIAEQARADGCGYLGGWFLPTNKNAPAAEFYQQSGFTLSEQVVGRQYWTLDLANHTIDPPAWIERRLLWQGVV